MAGDQTGEWTFHSMANAGRSVVDYFLLSGEVVGVTGNKLVVQPPADRFDHATLRLQLAGDSLAASAGPGSVEGLGPNPCGVEYRFVPSLLPALVDSLRGAQAALEAAAQAGAAATSLAQLATACEVFDGVVVASLDAVSIPARPPCANRRPLGWVQKTCRDPLTSRLRRRRRRALSGRDYALAVALNRQICAAARRHKRQHKRKMGRDVARLEFESPAAFHRLLKGEGEGADPSITASDWNSHFRSLLGYAHTEAATRASSSTQPPSTTHQSQALQRLHEPFILSELTAATKRVKNSKSCLGALKPEMLKGTIALLGPALVALLNACVRVGGMPARWAVSALTPIRKPGADHRLCDGYRGIAVGTLLAKLYAGMLQDRLATYTEGAGTRASGQAGFRPDYGCRDQQLALRAIIERQRARGHPLYACFVDFKQAFDRVPRHLLWQKLESAGLGGWALRAVQALYTTVPMCVKVPGGFASTFEATSGVKQGCPLSPILFGLYLDDFESGLVQQAAAAALPHWESGETVPPLFYADDQALLATTPAGLRFQLGYLENYCAAWGLTVNIKKTQVMVFCGRGAAGQESFRYAGHAVDTVPTFRYLGVHMHCRQSFVSAASFTAEAGRRAMHGLRRRLAANGLEDPMLSMRAFKTYVLPVLSYGAEIWAPQLILQGKSAAQQVQLEHLRGLLGVRDSAPALTVLAETGQLPLPIYWTLQLARFVRSLQRMDGDRVARLAFMDSIALAATAETGLALARQPWAAQVGLVFEAAGIPSDLADGTLGMPELTAALLARHIDSYAAASVKVQRYIESVRGGSVTAQTYGPASYMTAVPVRRHRRRLAQWRTGSHWLAEETGRWQGLLREQRPCPHCHNPLEDVRHVVYDCPLYAELRQEFGDLFPSTGIMPGLAEFLCQDSQGRLAKFADRCFDAHAAALAQ
ncbi:LINE-1 reverse transcriptase [Chlorella vulgaris]